MNARESALRIINDVNTNGAYANIALAQEIERGKFSDQDRRFVTELVYGTIKAGQTLDWYIEHYSSRPISKIAHIIRDILRMGIYQIFFLAKVPVSAACNQAVELAKTYGHPGSVKFVNAVLRSAARNPDKIKYPDQGTSPVQYLSLKYFHPEWLIKRWLAKHGFEFCEELCKINNLTPALSVRTNTLKTNRENLLNLLTEEGVVCEPSNLVPEGIICHEYPALSTLKPLKEGLFQVQDESSMLVSHVLAPSPGDFVIDACGAPGGKSTHIAALLQNKGRVLSLDLHEHKLTITRGNAERLGISIIETKAMDAVNLREHYFEQADRVLVDAPCSGLGVLRRKPDSRWRKHEDMLRDLPKLQLAILESAADCVKPGGVLVYSTCTTEVEENQEVVYALLKSRPEFTLQPAGLYLPTPKADEMIQFWPHVDKVDGFFIARLIKAK